MKLPFQGHNWRCEEASSFPPRNGGTARDSPLPKINGASYPQAPLPASCPRNCAGLQGQSSLSEIEQCLYIAFRRTCASSLRPLWLCKRQQKLISSLSLRTPISLRFTRSVSLYSLRILPSHVVFVVSGREKSLV